MTTVALLKKELFINIEENDGVICVNGPLGNTNFAIKIIDPNKNHSYMRSLATIRHFYWNDIPKTQKIIIKNIFIDIDNKVPYGDIWCAKWLVEYFGDNITFENCWFAKDYNNYDDDDDYLGYLMLTHLVNIDDLKIEIYVYDNMEKLNL